MVTMLSKIGQYKIESLASYLPSHNDFLKTQHLVLHNPSDICFAVAKQTAQVVADKLPQKTGGQAIEILTRHISYLKSSDYHKRVALDMEKEITSRRIALVEEYKKICGAYFEDPNSEIHQAWAHFEEEESSYNRVSALPFDRMSPTCYDRSLSVSVAFQHFLRLEQRKKTIEQELTNLGGTIRSHSMLFHALHKEKQMIVERDASLCGTGDNDLVAPLPRAKREYELSLLDSTDMIDVGALLNIYKIWEREHCQHVRSLFLIDQMLNAEITPELKFDAIVQQKIQTAVTQLQQLIKDQQSNVGIDWKKTAIYVMSGVGLPTLALAYY